MEQLDVSRELALRQATELTDVSVMNAWTHHIVSTSDTGTQTLALLVEYPENQFRIALLSIAVAIVIVVILVTIIHICWKRKR